MDAWAQDGASPSSELYLEVSLNGQDTGAVAPFVLGEHGLRSTVANLRELGLDPSLFGVTGGDSFDLNGIPGLRYSYDAQRQRIDLQLSDALRSPLLLQARAPRPAAPAGAGSGILLNYDLHTQLGNTRAVNAVTELRWFGPRGVLVNTGGALLAGAQRGYVRYETTWTRSDPESLSTLEAGDFVSSSLAWTRSLRMGGIQWRKNFALRPDLLTYPVASFGGAAVVPSSVSLYVNGIQQFRADVGNGPFQIRDIAGVSGAGLANIVTEDALGRTVTTALPLYIDTRLLDAGLTDYAVALGVPRRRYGMTSFDYASTPVLSASLRHGTSDALTLEGHFEGRAGLLNAGGAALARLGQAGVVDMALAGSAGGKKRGSGGQAMLGYQYIAPRFSLDMATMRASARYADSGVFEGVPVVRASDRVNVGLALAHGSSASAGFLNYRVPGQPQSRIASLAFSTVAGWGISANMSVYRDLRHPDVRGFMATLSIGLGNRAAASGSTGMQNGVRTRALSAAGAPDVAGGFGWSLQKGAYGEQNYGQAQLAYLGRDGEARAYIQSIGQNRIASVELSGAVVAMDGAVMATRRVGRGFALVSAGVADLPVWQENRLIGKTDAGGRLLVADLMPYVSNAIAIDVTNLPADTRLASTMQTVVPPLGGGVLAFFKVERYAAATVLVHLPGGKPAAPGVTARIDGGMTTVVGYDGMVFLDGLQPHNLLIVGEGEGRCAVRFEYAPSAGGALPSIGPLTCHPLEKPP